MTNERAYLHWKYRTYPYPDRDSEVSPSELEAPEGKLRQARKALFLSTGEMARRIGISRSRYARLERQEPGGRASLRALKAAAEAMGCELVYGIRPKCKRSFSELIWERIEAIAGGHSWVISRPVCRKVNALAAAAKWAMQDPTFRRSQKWTERLGGVDRFYDPSNPWRRRHFLSQAPQINSAAKRDVQKVGS